MISIYSIYEFLYEKIDYIRDQSIDSVTNIHTVSGMDFFCLIIVKYSYVWAI